MTKKIIAINGSPRKNNNTAVLLQKTLEGAASVGAETELIHLYELNFKGCRSCFACKLKDKNVDTCIVKDDLMPLFQKIRECDALILGSPIYFSDITGEMRSFIERLLFPYYSYDRKPSSFGKKIQTAFIYTMNAPKIYLGIGGYNAFIKRNKFMLKHVFGSSETLIVTETLQFDDYSKYAASRFNEGRRIKRHQSIFKKDCEKAFELGKKLIHSV